MSIISCVLGVIYVYVLRVYSSLIVILLPDIFLPFRCSLGGWNLSTSRAFPGFMTSWENVSVKRGTKPGSKLFFSICFGLTILFLVWKVSEFKVVHDYYSRSTLETLSTFNVVTYDWSWNLEK